jgi:hypothetical protein
VRTPSSHSIEELSRAGVATRGYAAIRLDRLIHPPGEPTVDV